MNFKNLIIISLIFISIATADDTTFVSDGVTTVFALTKVPDSSSILILSPDSIIIPKWRYDSGLHAIVFTTAIDSGKTVFIKYNANHYFAPITYSLFKKQYFLSSDTNAQKYLVKQGTDSYSDDLSVSGFKSFTVSADNNGEVNLQQGLDVRIDGSVRPGTTLSAHLSDQGSSLDGATREISEFDMIYVELKDPRFRILAGDQYINWLKKGILDQEKKIKGLSASINRDRFDITAFGALAGGKYAIQNIHAQDGIQGPYFLKGNGENTFITPVGGTVHLRKNGTELKETDDYTVDYDLGSVTLTNKHLVKRGDLIRVEYEYKLFDYQQLLGGGNARFKNRDSSIVASSVFWLESDNRNNPIDLVISPEDKEVLKQCGDSLPLISTEVAVNPKDVASKSALFPLYKKVTDARNGEYFEYVQYDPNKPEENTGFYYVWFNNVGENKGDYIDTTSPGSRFTYYKFKGPRMGNYNPIKTLPAPKQIMRGEITSEIKKRFISLETQIAGENIDNNVFSSKDDNDNNSSAIRSSFFLGDRLSSHQRIWFSGSTQYASKNFSREILSLNEKFNQWNDSTIAGKREDLFLFNSEVGFSPFQNLKTETGYGQSRRSNRLITDKITNTSSLYTSLLQLEYAGFFFRHFDSLQKKSSRKQSLSSVWDRKNNKAEIAFREEWRMDSLNSGSGMIEGMVSYLLKPVNLKQTFTYASLRKGVDQFSAHDTGYRYQWDQSVNFDLTSKWKFKGNSSYYKSNAYNQAKTGSFLIDLQNTLDFSSFTSTQNYATNFEKASSFVQVPIYAGNGLGTHMYDSVLNEFIPHVPGDWFLQQREVFDQTSDSRIRKTSFDLTWSFRPFKTLKGILNDLEWDGVLTLNEHLDSENEHLGSWVPGYVTLRDYFRKSNALPASRYADLSYLQNISWNPKNSNHLSGSLTVQPSLKKIRTYVETPFNLGIKINYNKKRWFLSDETKFSTLKHNDSIGRDFSYKDLNTLFTQRFEIGNGFSVELKECAGFANQVENLQLPPLWQSDNTFYYQLSPGLKWIKSEAGTAEISYTFSSIPLFNNMDFRVANGFQSGLSHVFSANVGIQTGKHVVVNGYYRGEINDKKNGSQKTNSHTISLEAKVLF